jgi:glycosyltransferase involved in cell wall biosynthesis
MMRIAFLDSWLQSSAEGSGTAVAIGGLHRALERRGIRVSRLAPASPRPYGLIARRLIFNAQLPALLRSFDYDLVVGIDIDGFLWSRLRPYGHPYLASIKGVLAEEARQEHGAPYRMLKSLSFLEMANARAAQAVLSTSDYCRQAIQRHYGIAKQQIRIVPEGIDLPRWRQIAHETPKQSDGQTILCVARQYPRKHVADLLRAMPVVRQHFPNAKALIVGDGPEHGDLQRLAAELHLGDAAQLLGAIPDDNALARMYRRADIFCLPSVQEGFGIVYLEAMASGLPIVATKAAAIPEVVPHGQAGLLIQPGNVAELADSLCDLLGNPDRRNALGQFGQEYVARYDWDAVAEQFLNQVQPFLRPSGIPPLTHPATTN